MICYVNQIMPIYRERFGGLKMISFGKEWHIQTVHCTIYIVLNTFWGVRYPTIFSLTMWVCGPIST